MVHRPRWSLDTCPTALLSPTHPVGKGGSPPHKLTEAPSKTPPNGRRSLGEDASTRRLGGPRSGAPSRSVGALSPIVRCRLGLAHGASRA
eukprot:978864-Alexandrium_andersonii.AAC.1